MSEKENSVVVQVSEKKRGTSGDSSPAKPGVKAGLGGWMILVGLNVVAAPFITFFRLSQICSWIFSDGYWHALTSPDSPEYHPFWKPILIGEITLTLFLALGFMWLFYLFFAKKALFPKIFVSIVAFGLLFLIVDTFCLYILLSDSFFIDLDTIRNLVHLSLVLVILGPYVYLSKRAKATFVN